MTQALVVDEATPELGEGIVEKKPLRACVEEAIDEYFKQLDGHTTDDLYNMVLQEVEEPLFKCVLQYTRGNQSKASIMLGINRGTLRKKLKFYGMHD